MTPDVFQPAEVNAVQDDSMESSLVYTLSAFCPCTHHIATRATGAVTLVRGRFSRLFCQEVRMQEVQQQQKDIFLKSADYVVFRVLTDEDDGKLNPKDVLNVTGDHHTNPH